MNEYNIDLHDSKGRESRVISGEFGSDEDIAKALLSAIQTAKHYGYCRVTLDIALENKVHPELLLEPGIAEHDRLLREYVDLE